MRLSYVEPDDRMLRTPAERAALERLAEIDNDPTHPANGNRTVLRFRDKAGDPSVVNGR